MSQMCVNHIVVPSGKFILSNFIVTCLLSTSALSMIKIVVVPVSAIALFAAMLSAFKYCGMGLPNVAQAVAATNGRSLICLWGERLDVMMVASSSSQTTILLADLFKVGSKGRILAETEWLHLFALSIFAPHHQTFVGKMF